MQHNAATIGPMGKKKTTDDKGDEGKVRAGYAVFARIPDELGALLDSFLEAQPYQVTLASFVKKAIQEQLAREGYTLPKPKKGGGE